MYTLGIFKNELAFRLDDNLGAIYCHNSSNKYSFLTGTELNTLCKLAKANMTINYVNKGYTRWTHDLVCMIILD